MPLETKRFKVVNEGFVCLNCGRDVHPTSGTTPRDHCPYCLWGRHVDINPGDRANKCKGPLEPIGIYTHTKKTYIIIYRCKSCGERVRSKAIMKDENVADDPELLVELSTLAIEEE